MNNGAARRRCAIYTRKSSEEGLEQDFNSLDAQREACEAFVRSQKGEGWQLVRTLYDDGGFSGGSIQRPALSALLADIRSGHIDVIVVCKVDRLSRSLADFVRLVELFDQHDVSFVSVTQQFNTSTSMGRLTLNVLLSFAQFEREVTGERIRDKIAASKRKGLWMGGRVPLGYRVEDKRLIIDEAEATTVRDIFCRYLELASVRKLKAALEKSELYEAPIGAQSRSRGPQTRGALYHLLSNPIYIGQVRHKGQVFDGQHAPILDQALWDKVQAQLESNRQQRVRQSNARHPSLLAGLIFDDQGHAMSPSHANKGTRRYRYYTSQALLLYRDREAGNVVRVPAEDVETVVVNELKRRIGTPLRLLETLDTDGWPAQKVDQVIKRGQMLASEWDEQPASDRIGYLKDLIRRVMVSRTSIEIVFWASRWASVLLPNAPDANSALSDVTENLPAKLRRSGRETRLVIENDDPPPASAASQEALRSAVEKAMSWNDQLIKGEVASARAIAEREGVSERYIGRILHLAWLAPDIVRVIRAGEAPETLTLARLQKGYPLAWAQQRAVLLGC